MLRRYVTKVLTLLCATVMLTVAAGCAAQSSTAPQASSRPTLPTLPPETPAPALQLLSVETAEEWVEVKTTYGDFHYPAAFADILAVEAATIDGVARLDFIAQLAEQSVVIYTIYYDKASGNRCGTLKLSDTTDEMMVYVTFAVDLDAIPSDWHETFYAVQETFNDVLLSMAEDTRFTPMEPGGTDT